MSDDDGGFCLKCGYEMCQRCGVCAMCGSNLEGVDVPALVADNGRLLKERDKLKGEVKRLRERDKSGVSPEDWEQLNVLDSLRDENKKLRDPLAPLAAIADLFDLYEGPPCYNPRACDGYLVVTKQHSETVAAITVGDCRRARAALATAKPKG